MLVRNPILALLILVGCDAKRPAGEACKQSRDCADGLVCVSELCAEGIRVAKERAQRIQALVQTHMHEHAGECPASVGDLRDGNNILDPWDRSFRLQCPGQSAAVDVISNGPDGQPDTADDISTASP